MSAPSRTDPPQITTTKSPPTKPTPSVSSPKPSSSSSGATPTKRLLAELSALPTPFNTPSSPSPIERLAPVSESDLFHWEAVISGKGLGKGYDNGRWLLDIVIPDGKGKDGGGAAYPFAPPKVRFVTRVVAPNVMFLTGEICLDLLKTAWTPAYTLQMTVEAIWQMLAAPGVDSPLNVDVTALIRQGDGIGAESLVRWGVGQFKYNGR